MEEFYSYHRLSKLTSNLFKKTRKSFERTSTFDNENELSAILQELRRLFHIKIWQKIKLTRKAENQNAKAERSV
jgi:hypothetical protein